MMWGLFGVSADRSSMNTKKLLLKSNKILNSRNQTNLDMNQTTKIPQTDSKKSYFNDTTQKSLFKINLLIKRFLFSYDTKKIDYINERMPDGGNSRHIINGGNYKCKPIKKKSTKELYREAAQLLGIYCTLSDDCRCIDCQSQYFDCDYEDIDIDDDNEITHDDDEEDNDVDIDDNQYSNCYCYETTEQHSNSNLQSQNNPNESPISVTFTSINDFGYNTFN